MQTLERPAPQPDDKGNGTGTGDDLGLGGRTVGGYLRYILAACMLGASAIHFAVMGSHFEDGWADGTFFAVVGWLQLVLAVALVVRPTRPVLWSVVGLNALVIATWILSRTAGVPFGAHAGEPEDVRFVDAFAAVLQGVTIAGALALLSPSVARRPVSRELGLGGVAVIGVTVAVFSTLAFVPAFAGETGHEHGGEAAAGHGGAAGEHAHGVTDGSNLQETSVGAIVAGALTGDSPCELSGPPASPGQAAQDAEGHDHRGPFKQEPLSREDRALLQQQMAQARTVIDRFPTVAAAEAAGYRKSTAFVPCIGAHYTNVGLVARFDHAAPSELLFDGTAPDSKIVGLSYLIHHPGGEPEGFAGPNDRWHQHNVNGGLCFKGGVVVAGEKASVAECEALGGQKRELTDIWMVHAWVVPGWECSWGVFAGECPELGGRAGLTAWDAPDPKFAREVADDAVGEASKE